MLSVVAQYGVTLALRSPAGKGMSFDELQNAMREINRLEADLTALDGGGPSGLTGDLSARRGAVRPADAAADLDGSALSSRAAFGEDPAAASAGRFSGLGCHRPLNY